MKKIYVILTQSGTWFSKILKLVTKDNYNHSSICLKDDFQTFYSFGRKYPYFILPGGFIIENAFQHVFARFKKIPCLILEKEVCDEQYLKLENIINEFRNHSKQYSYAIISLMLADTSFSAINQEKFFCSQFVAKLLNDIHIHTPKPPEHMHPIDFLKIDGMQILFEGDLKEFVKKKALVKAIN